MAKEILMPDLGTATSEIVLARWLKEEGDTVKRGEPLCVVETDKAVSELESVADGVLLRREVEVGGSVQTGAVIAYIGRPGEEIPAPRPAGAAAAGPDPGKPGAPSRAIKASPMIVNFAARSGVDLTGIEGTGPGGQITRADVLKAKEGVASALQGPGRRLLSKGQIAVARAVAASWRDSVPISLWATVRMERAIAIRESKGAGRCPAFDSIFVFAASRVIPDFPDFLSAFDGQALVAARGVDIAVAISGEDSLALPVVRDADRKPLDAIDAEVRNFAFRNASGGLGAGDLGGAMFTVSNLGMMPIDAFTAIIPPGQAAILTAGRVREISSAGGDPGGASRSVQVVLTVDHRFINGREAASFLTRFKEAMEAL